MKYRTKLLKVKWSKFHLSSLLSDEVMSSNSYCARFAYLAIQSYGETTYSFNES